MLTILSLSAVAYADEPAEWAKTEIDFAISQELVPENLLNHYEQAITREEFCVLAIKMLTTYYHMSIDELVEWKTGDMPANDTFVDTKEPAVLAAKALGITNGTDATHFSPNALLTREMAAVFLAKTAKVTTYYMEKPAPAYNDINAAATWAKSYLGYLYEHEIMKGTADNQFQPKASYQRQQAILTIARLYTTIEKLQRADIGADDDKSFSFNTGGNNGATVIISANEKGEEVSYEKLLTELSYLPYQKDYKAVYKGIYNYGDGTEKVKKVVYHKFYREDEYVVREENYSDDVLAWLNIFSPLAYETFTRMYRNAEYAETFEGNMLATRSLDPDYLAEIKAGSTKEFTAHYIQKDNKKLVSIFSVSSESVERYLFEAETGLILEYHHTYGNSIDDFWAEEWSLESLEENLDINQDLFDSEKVQ